MKLFRSLAICFLLGLLLTTGIAPGFSQNITRENHLISVNKTKQQSNRIEAQNLVQKGKEFYQAERYQEAINKLEQAANRFANSSELELEAITKSNLSLAYQQLGKWEKARNAIDQSLKLLEFKYDLNSPDTWKIENITTERRSILTQVINTYGRLLYFQGNFDLSLASWQFVTKISQKLNDNRGIVTSQINQLQALLALGLFQKAKNISEVVQRNLDYLPDNVKSQGLISLSNVFRTTGDLANSEQFLQKGLELAKSSQSQLNLTTIDLSLADTWQAMGNLERERQLPIRYEYVPWRCDQKALSS